MTLDQAHEMGWSGTTLYLFVDKESERPSVVYRQRIRLRRHLAEPGRGRLTAVRTTPRTTGWPERATPSWLSTLLTSPAAHPTCHDAPRRADDRHEPMIRVLVVDDQSCSVRA